MSKPVSFMKQTFQQCETFCLIIAFKMSNVKVCGESNINRFTDLFEYS